jgi:argininosuccinate lyase
MVHLSRLAEEVVWWTNPRFGYLRPSDAFSTGSSMMPNKRNPDPAELVRGRTAGVIAALTGSLVLLKGLPASYQRDLQEDKPALFAALQTLEASLRVMTGLVAGLRVDEARMAEAAGEGYTTATAVADALVERGVTFRVAHGVAGRLVVAAEGVGVGLDAVSDHAVVEALREADDPVARELASQAGIPGAFRAAATVEGALARFDVIGGTAPGRVAAELRAAEERLGLA